MYTQILMYKKHQSIIEIFEGQIRLCVCCFHKKETQKENNNIKKLYITFKFSKLFVFQRLNKKF